MNRQKALLTLGLAQRAGKVVSGESLVLEQVRKEETTLVFLASDAGFNTTKRITDKASFHQIPLIRNFTSAELSRAIGKNNRMTLCITDSYFHTCLYDIIHEIT